MKKSYKYVKLFKLDLKYCIILYYYTTSINMVILKDNEIQLNPNGATMKANKQEIEKWKKNIDEYFESLNYTITIKELNNNLISQHTYCSESNRLVFEFHAPGRVVIKTKNIDKLQILFMEKADIIVGTKLQN